LAEALGKVAQTRVAQVFPVVPAAVGEAGVDAHFGDVDRARAVAVAHEGLRVDSRREGQQRQQQQETAGCFWCF
jgi:hypothetical protein